MSIFEKTVQVNAGSQFLGTEFAAQPTKSWQGLRVREVEVTMGNELKAWQVRKTAPADPAGVVSGSTTPGTTAFSTIVRQSLTGTPPAPGQNNDTSVFIVTAPGLDSVLLPGEQWQITTQNATSAMSARIQYEEVDVAPRRTNA